MCSLNLRPHVLRLLERLAVDAVLRSVARPIYVPVEVTASTLKRLREEDRTAYDAVPSVEESFFRSEIFEDENEGLLGNQTLSTERTTLTDTARGSEKKHACWVARRLATLCEKKIKNLIFSREASRGGIF